MNTCIICGRKHNKVISTNGVCPFCQHRLNKGQKAVIERLWDGTKTGRVIWNTDGDSNVRTVSVREFVQLRNMVPSEAVVDYNETGIPYSIIFHWVYHKLLWDIIANSCEQWKEDPDYIEDYATDVICKMFPDYDQFGSSPCAVNEIAATDEEYYRCACCPLSWPEIKGTPIMESPEGVTSPHNSRCPSCDDIKYIFYEALENGQHEKAKEIALQVRDLPLSDVAKNYYIDDMLVCTDTDFDWGTIWRA